MFKRILSIILIIMVSLGAFMGCSNKTESSNSKKAENTVDSNDSSEKPKHIKIGCVPTTEQPANFIKEAIEATGNTAELLLFDGNNLPATALKDGDLDAVFANHLPWIEVFSKENNCDLQMVQPYFYYSPFRMYSTKYNSIEELPDNAKIIIPNDPANRDRSIRMLSELKLIELGEKKEDYYSLLDITNNPKNLQFTEIEITNTARSINDVDAVFSMAFIAQQTGNIDPNVYLYEDPQSITYKMGLIVKGEDVNSKWATDAMNELKTEENEKKFNDTFKGAFTFIKK